MNARVWNKNPVIAQASSKVGGNKKASLRWLIFALKILWFHFLVRYKED